MVIVEGPEVRVYTDTLTAVFSNGALVSLSRKSDGREFVSGKAGERPALELVFAKAESSPIGTEDGDRVTCIQINERSAEMRFEGWNGDGIVAVSEDGETGDLVVEPSAYSSRPGLRSCRWTIGGIDKELELVAPFFQGVKLPLEDPLIAGGRCQWPHYWEAGLAIFQGARGGFWVHCQDTRYRYKALKVGAAKDARSVGFETESYGPMEANLSAGGLAWRVNVYSGDWKTPAGEYRDWLWKAWGLDGAERRDWLAGLRFAVSWCPNDPTILDGLAKRLDPGSVLLHIHQWRADGYDQNYPTYKASAKGAEFMKQARKMGFRAMPHFNSIDMDPTHTAYTYIRDFQYRDIETKKVQGWTWASGKVLPVPESNAARLKHQKENAMVKIHPGLSMWRSILAENVAQAAGELDLDVAFLDVTLNTWNLYNCLVDDMTPTEGMRKLTDEIAGLGKGLAVGGEGRNEITMQSQHFGQVHLFESWQENAEGLERTGGCDLNEFLFGRICRSFGYTNLSGRTPETALRMRLHIEHGAIPTVTVHSGAEIANPNKAVKEMLDLAAR
jgi:hypothetical protein